MKHLNPAPVSLTRMHTSYSKSTPAATGPGLRTMFQITIPLDDVPPPFRDAEVHKNYELLANTAMCRTGERVSTPNRMKVLTLATGVEKHRLRRQQQLLLDIAQRCKEQDITHLSSSLSRKCALSSLRDKYQRDMKEYSTNTMLFKTWENALNQKEAEAAIEQNSARIPYERGNTYFPARRIKKPPPKELYMSKTPPTPQMSYANGLQIKVPYDLDKKRALIAERKINGPIQLDLYSSPKNDKLRPLILPSIKYIGVDLDKVNSYIHSRKVKMISSFDRHPLAIQAGEVLPTEPYRGPERLIIHTNPPRIKSNTALPTQVAMSDLNQLINQASQRDQEAPPPTQRSHAKDQEVTEQAQQQPKDTDNALEQNTDVKPTTDATEQAD